MLLNTSIFNSVVETARAKSADNPAMLRAIDRAVVEINRSRYWAFDSQSNTLRIQSTTSRKLYIVDDAHTCEARTVCKHRVARRLLQRYTEACQASAVVAERSRVQNWDTKQGHTVREFSRVHHLMPEKETPAQFWARVSKMPLTSLANVRPLKLSEMTTARNR